MFKKRNNFHSDYYGNRNYNQSYSKPTKKKKPKGEFGSYCFSLMKQSLITGFPVIADSKSKVRRTVKALVFVVCTAGFFFQTWSFLDMYLEFPTILDISVHHPEQIEAPAVTICNRNRLWRQPFCETFRDYCVFKYEGWNDFCETYPLYCPLMKPQNHVFAHVDIRVVYNQNLSNEVLDALGPQREKDLIIGCTIKGVGKSRPCGSSTPIQAAMDGFPYKCFSLFSLLGAPDDEPNNLTLTDEYNIFLDLHPEEYINPKDLIQAYVYIHDPRSVTNPTADGVTLKAGNKYRLYVTMQKRESLPPPYKSNCTDYLKTWRKNGGYGPITKRGCTDWCKIQAMIKEYGCVAQTIKYPNNFTICSDNTIVTSDEVNAICSASCNDACEHKAAYRMVVASRRSSYYTITTEVVDDIGEQMCKEKDVHCRRVQFLYVMRTWIKNLLSLTIYICINNFYGIKNKNLIVKVSFSRMNIQTFKHEPKFQSVELFSYIGGYMGMWLGISLVSLFDFVEMLVDVLAYPVIKYKKSRSKVNQAERMQRNITYNMYDI